MAERERGRQCKQQKPFRVKEHRTFLSLGHNLESDVCHFPLTEKHFWSADSFELRNQLLKESSACVLGVTKGSQGSDFISRDSSWSRFPPLWNYPCFLPSGGFLRTDIHPGVPEATCCPKFTARSGTEQTQIRRTNRTCSCCLKSHSCPSRLLQCWEIFL